MQTHTNETHHANGKQLNTLFNYKQIKHTIQLQINELHYGTANKRRTLCNCK